MDKITTFLLGAAFAYWTICVWLVVNDFYYGAWPNWVLLDITICGGLLFLVIVFSAFW